MTTRNHEPRCDSCGNPIRGGVQRRSGVGLALHANKDECKQARAAREDRAGGASPRKARMMADIHPDTTREELLVLLRRFYLAVMKPHWKEGETINEVTPDVRWALDMGPGDDWRPEPED